MKVKAKPLSVQGGNGKNAHIVRTQAKELFNVSRSKIDIASYVHNRDFDLAAKVH